MIEKKIDINRPSFIMYNQTINFIGILNDSSKVNKHIIIVGEKNGHSDYRVIAGFTIFTRNVTSVCMYSNLTLIAQVCTFD